MFDTIPFTSVHSNLEHGLVMLTESFSPLKSVLNAQNRSDTKPTRFPFVIYVTWYPGTR